MKEETKVLTENKIIQLDCLSFLEEAPSNSIDLCIADPPYNINKKFKKFEFKK